MLTEHPVLLGGRPVVLEKPRNSDDLISEADYARDERLPYWADLWPASVVLAGVVLAQPAIPATAGEGAPPAGATAGSRGGPRALELGCGLGLVTVAAILAGYDVTATDYYEDALLFTARNAVRTTGVEPTLRNVDWRALPADLGRFELVLAADVLYERPHAELVADLLAQVLAAEGRMLLADQGRLGLASFLEGARARGFTHRAILTAPPPEPAEAPENSRLAPITVYELRHA
ncbi:MAG: protein N-lysine methyltransferase family protein [Gemmatimonadota bacterium]|nr:protein N-lysine methyltransferase family protein [Gemmatimonadota bacterium]